MNVDMICRVVHEAIGAWKVANGDMSQPGWDDAPDHMKKPTLEVVRKLLDNPDYSYEDAHNVWMESKINDGWIYGPEKDPVLKTHPCLVPYCDLTTEEHVKDAIFHSIVSVMGDFLELYD